MKIKNNEQNLKQLWGTIDCISMCTTGGQKEKRKGHGRYLKNYAGKLAKCDRKYEIYIFKKLNEVQVG